MESYLLPSGVSFSEFLFPGMGLLERAFPCDRVAVNMGLFPRSRDLERGVLRPLSGGWSSSELEPERLPLLFREPNGDKRDFWSGVRCLGEREDSPSSCDALLSSPLFAVFLLVVFFRRGALNKRQTKQTYIKHCTLKFDKEKSQANMKN